MAMVNEKLLRLLLALVGLAALGALGWRIYDYATNRPAYFPVSDLRKLQETAGVGPRTDPGHLLPFPEYQVIETLNITGKEKPREEVVKAPTPPPPVLSERDLQLQYVQFVSAGSPSNAAYLQPSDERPDEQSSDIPGDLYRTGQRIRVASKKDLDVRLLEIREESVVVGFGEGEAAGKIELSMAVHDLPAETVGSLFGGTGTQPDGPIVSSAPKETRLNEAGEFEVGTADVTYFESLTQEQLLSAIPVRSERDRFSNEVRGLRIQSVPADSPFARLGLRAEDVVLEVNGVPALSRDDLLETLRRTSTKSVEVKIERLGATRTLTYRLP